MPTIKQIAEHAGVSPATVSRVLNAHPKVSPELYQRVRNSIATLGYHPSAVARNLRRQETHNIGLVVPDSSNPFFALIARGIEDTFYEAGYSVYLCNSEDDDSKEFEYCRNLYQQRVAGVIMSSTGSIVDGIQYLQEKGMPVVQVDRGYDVLDADRVQSDHYAGACEAMEYLIGLGHQRFGLIMGQRRHPPVQARLQACLDILSKYDLSLTDEMMIETQNYAYEAGYAGARTLLSARGRPTAIFAFNDTIAVGALRFALEQGIAVPDELSILGVDDIPLSSFVTPRLTTIAQSTNDLGRAAAELLLRRIRGETGESVHINFPSKLVIRESTGKIALG